MLKPMKQTCSPIYIGWSDVTYLWSQCDRHFVGQHVVLFVVKWWRLVALFEYNWISSFKKMSALSLSYWESDVYVYWRQNNKHFAELAPQNGGKQLIWRNYVTVTYVLYSPLPNFSDICLEADQNLFRKVLHNPQHVLHQLLPPVSASSHSYFLRTRSHNRQLPDRLSHLIDCNFIIRMLFYQSYWHF